MVLSSGLSPDKKNKLGMPSVSVVAMVNTHKGTKLMLNTPRCTQLLIYDTCGWHTLIRIKVREFDAYSNAYNIALKIWMFYETKFR